MVEPVTELPGPVKPWYKEGLKFKCTGCGKCCTGGPGYVWVSEDEITAMATFLKISNKQFVQQYTRMAFGRLALLENKISFDCVFLKGKQCKIYEARPKQCRKFPWWEENLKSPERWAETAKECEGIDHPDAPLINLETIEKERC
jgi:Fe-S-cluster containining protein